MPVADEVAERVHALLDASESRVRRRWLELTDWLREHNQLGEVTRLIEAGRGAEAVQHVEDAARVFAAEVTQTYTVAAQAEAKIISGETRLRVVYDQVNERAVAAARANSLELVREITNEQRDTFRRVLSDGAVRGANPREVARELRDSLGLTRQQLDYVDNYRRQLEIGDRAALARMLRDKRTDRSVIAAAEGRRVLSPDQIDRMVERYRANWIRYRAEVIGRTEGMRAVHTGAMATWQQIFDSGKLSPQDVVRTWIATLDVRVRDSHRGMHGAEVGWEEPFVSGHEIELWFPGDPDAPAAETVNCRCGMTVRMKASALRSQIAVPRGVEDLEREPIAPIGPVDAEPIEPVEIEPLIEEPEAAEPPSLAMTPDDMRNVADAFSGVDNPGVQEAVRDYLRTVCDQYGVAWRGEDYARMHGATGLVGDTTYRVVTEAEMDTLAPGAAAVRDWNGEIAVRDFAHEGLIRLLRELAVGEEVKGPASVILGIPIHEQLHGAGPVFRYAGKEAIFVEEVTTELASQRASMDSLGAARSESTAYIDYREIVRDALAGLEIEDPVASFDLLYAGALRFKRLSVAISDPIAKLAETYVEEAFERGLVGQADRGRLARKVEILMRSAL